MRGVSVSWGLGLMLAGGMVACGPQVSLEGDSEASTGGSPGTSSGPTSGMSADDTTGTTEVAEVGVDTCLGECGVECFSDEDCGPGATCDQFNICHPLPQLEVCPPENLHTLELLVDGSVVDVEIEALNGPGTTAIVAMLQPAELVLFPAVGPPLTFDGGDGIVSQMSVGDINGDTFADVAYAVAGEIRVMYGDPMQVLGPPITVLPGRMMAPLGEPAEIELGRVNGDPRADLAVVQLEPEPTFYVFASNMMGGLNPSFGTPIQNAAELGDRFEFATRALGGMTGALAGQGEVRRVSVDPTGTILENNPMRIANTFVNELAVDVSVEPIGSGEDEIVMGILNLAGWTMIARAEFSAATADVERWALPQPSRRIRTNSFGVFDYVLATESGQALVVRGDCYDEYALASPADEIALGEYSGMGTDIAIGTDAGLYLLSPAP